ncbi:MAG: neutral/alkaline non-lysosomal ceramidase N-terminal domain-containing protein [Chloroflexota bacterium]
MAKLLAGVGRVNITPPLGVDLMGTARRAGPADGIHHDLYATCLVLATGNQKVALVDCDLLIIPDEASIDIRQRIGALIEAGREHVLLGCTHTHNGPAAAQGMPKTGGDLTGFRDIELNYQANLVHQLESAARLAMANLRPARFAAGAGQADILVNRRELLDDGQVIIGRDFDRPRDPSVDILRIDTEDSEPLAVIMCFACHPVSIDPQFCTLIGPDFPGWARQTIEMLTGATALYFTGAAGDIMPLRADQADPRAAEIVGRQVGCQATYAYMDLNPQPIEIREGLVKSISTYRYYEEVPVKRPAITHFKALSRQLELKLRPPPALADVEEDLRTAEARLQELQAQGASSANELNPVIFQQVTARRILEMLRTGIAPQSIQVDIQAIRLDDVAIVAVPGEPFAEMGLQVKAGSPFKHTFFIGYANGLVGYIPMESDHALGGYEVNDAHKPFGLPAGLVAGTAEQIVETCLELLHELHDLDEITT